MLAVLALGVPSPPPAAPEPATWDLAAVFIESVSVTVPGLRRPTRIETRLTAADVARLRRELAAFAARVRRDTQGRLVVRIRRFTVPGPLRTVSGPGPFWIAPADVAPILGTRVDPKRFDTVMAFAKIGDDLGPAVPVRHLGGALGGDRGIGGACFAGIGFRPKWIDGTGTVALHEFLHGLRWALVEVGGFPAADLPDPDMGRLGPTCCPDAPVGDGPFADHLLRRHVTAAMCAAADARRGPAVPDGYLRGFAVDGVPPAGDWRTVTLPTSGRTATAKLPPGITEVEVSTDAPVRVDAGNGPPTLVRSRGRVAVSGRRLEITRAGSGTEIRFDVKVAAEDPAPRE